MSELPKGLTEFVSQSGWGDAAIEPIPGDASFRRYFRLRRQGGETAMLMHAPPPQEDPVPFLDVAAWLTQNGLRAPRIIAANAPDGWVLTEDFGDARMKEWIDQNPHDETAAYESAIDAIAALYTLPAGPFAPYDLPTYLRETDLLTQWYCKAQDLAVDVPGYSAAWEAVLTPMIARQTRNVTVLRDYHAENIMLLSGRAGAPQGLIDFQDALVGHPAYDLVSLLQDARRDVPEQVEADMFARYAEKTGVGDDFAADYAILGAQRNAKIVGIFTRLAKRDGKPRYLDMIPRVWAYLERDLAHDALRPVADWFDANIPDHVRAAGGRVAL